MMLLCIICSSFSTVAPSCPRLAPSRSGTLWHLLMIDGARKMEVFASTVYDCLCVTVSIMCYIRWIFWWISYQFFGTVYSDVTDISSRSWPWLAHWPTLYLQVYFGSTVDWYITERLFMWLTLTFWLIMCQVMVLLTYNSTDIVSDVCIITSF